MLNLALPHINILSKVDLIEQYGSLAFDLEFYTQVQDLSYLLKRDALYDDDEENENNDAADDDKKESVNNNNGSDNDDDDSAGGAQNKFTLLHEALIQLIEDYNHVQFLTLDIQDKQSVYKVLQAIDKANGYVFGIMGETRFLIQQEQKLLHEQEEQANGIDNDEEDDD